MYCWVNTKHGSQAMKTRQLEKTQSCKDASEKGKCADDM